MKLEQFKRHLRNPKEWEAFECEVEDLRKRLFQFYNNENFILIKPETRKHLTALRRELVWLKKNDTAPSAIELLWTNNGKGLGWADACRFHKNLIEDIDDLLTLKTKRDIRSRYSRLFAINAVNLHEGFLKGSPSAGRAGLTVKLAQYLISEKKDFKADFGDCDDDTVSGWIKKVLE